MLITLSGLDGAGKSTLTAALRSELEAQGYSTTLLHMNKEVGVYAYVRLIRDRLLRRPSLPPSSPSAERPAEPSATAGSFKRLRDRIVWGRELRRVVDLADLLTFFAYRLLIERVRGRVLIMDRYLYDRLADAADGRKWSYLRWFARLTPVPDLAVFVDVSPEVAFARKGEFSIPWMTARRAYYKEIFSWVPGSLILPNEDLARSTAELKRSVAILIARQPARLAVGS
jgi:thymidylate kinase